MKEIDVDSRSFDQFVARAQALATSPVTASIIAEGDPAAYWAPLEFGSGYGRRPWPRPGPRTTVTSGRVFSRQAVGGYVFRNSKRFTQFLFDALRRRILPGKILSRADLVIAANEASQQAKDLIVSGAPSDTGALKKAIKVKGAQ